MENLVDVRSFYVVGKQKDQTGSDNPGFSEKRYFSMYGKKEVSNFFADFKPHTKTVAYTPVIYACHKSVR
jgi:hypothetical protein